MRRDHPAGARATHTALASGEDATLGAAARVFVAKDKGAIIEVTFTPTIDGDSTTKGGRHEMVISRIADTGGGSV